MSNDADNLDALPLPVGTVTLLFSDIEGSTRLLEHLGSAYTDLVATHHRLLRQAFAANDGRVIDSPGDGFFVVFSRADDAARAAISAQMAIAAEAWPQGVSVHVRMGLHTGSPMPTADRYIGMDVHRGARIAAVAHGGQVILSMATWGLLTEALRTSVDVLDLGEHHLKDIPQPERLLQISVPGGRTVFPPLRTLSQRLHHFPATPTALIGREREVDAVKALLQRPDVRLVTLSGMGGIGKTRLALKVGDEVAEAFPDGVWFVELASVRDPALLVSAIAKAIGVQEGAGRSLLDALREHLKSRKLLLVLDNFEQILPAANQIAELLAACAGLRALVTSRAVLRLAGEHDVPVPPLTLPAPEHQTSLATSDALNSSEAVRLFVERASAVRPGIDLSAPAMRSIVEICVRLDGLPLAIELAAARLRLFAPAELLGRLNRRLPLLTGGARDLPVRHQTLRQAIAWSHDLLSTEEQQLFRQLAVFSGSLTAEAVEAVCKLPDDAGTDVLDVLGSLLDKSLLRRNDGTGGNSRFVMLEMIREFAAEQLEKSPEAEAVRRDHASYFLALAEAGDRELRGRDQLQWLERLEVEHDNFRAALTWSIDGSGDAEIGARLAGALWWFWGVRGHFSEGRRWTSRATDASDRFPLDVQASLARAMANFAFVQGDYARAQALAVDARAQFLSLGRHIDAVWMHGQQAISTQYHGDAVRASSLLDEALQTARPLDDAWMTAWMLRNLGRIAYDREDSAAAERYLGESLTLTRRIGDVRGIALSLHYLGVIALNRGSDQSSRYLADSVDLFRRIDDRRGLAWALHYLAASALERGHGRDAELFEAESLSLRKDLGDKRGIAECLEGHACRLATEGHNAAALRIFATAEALRGAIGAPGSPADRARVQSYLGRARAAVAPTAAADAWRSGRTARVEDVIDGLSSAAPGVRASD